MAVLVSNCGGDENGNLWGGAAGDQTGREYKVAPWSNWGQVAIYRHPDPKVRKALAKKGRAAAENDLVGYDQGQRMTYFTQLKRAGWDPAKIAVKCEADCSSSTGANIVAVGHDLNDARLKEYDYSLSTHSMNSALIAAGFQKLTASKYLSSSAYLLAGDIQLDPGYHVNIVITDGSKAASEGTATTPQFYAAAIHVTVASECNIRSAPSMADSAKVSGFDPGDSFVADGLVFADGHVWATYIGMSSGKRRYVSLGTQHSWLVVP